MMTLPRIMVAPTGARRTKADHPQLPMTPQEIAATARECQLAGADAIHAHVRADGGGHLLDATRYRQVIDLVAEQAPGMLVQVSTEAVGRYTPEAQMQMVRDLRPAAISAALRELAPAGSDEPAAARFYQWCAAADIAVQHILYDAADLERLVGLVASGAVDGASLSLLYVLGRYSVDQSSAPSDLESFLDAAGGLSHAPDWMVCAFGQGETACLAAALRAGGKARVGFENNLLHADGSVAPSNQARVAAIRLIAEAIASTPRQGEGQP
ncbi:3-keto-5-aminohexanoate cleavage protein [Devosia lacusdianchii]|uniref:3-keto-5-aminohexanoate cleavage protein n=1 Tax=Devosia lacusdianchii TaxID=2917991 RepID=UPI001F05FCB9|nr:3-keto-5-aminohexanoate cleavage protein [Devosia sp. JXJ CY 41]